MTPSLVLDGTTERTDRVDVLQLTSGSELIGPDGADRHVGVDPHRTLLHLGVADLDGEQDVAQLRHIGLGVRHGADVGPAHDLDQRHPGPVVVDERVRRVVDATTPTDMRRLAGVLFDVGPFDPDDGAVRERQLTIGVGRLVVLGGLEVLRHVRIEVVLAGHHRRMHLAPDRSSEPHGVLDRSFVHDRQGAGQADTGGTGERVRDVTERVLAATEQLRLSRQLDMDLETDDELPLVGQRWLVHAHAATSEFGAAASRAAAA